MQPVAEASFDTVTITPESVAVLSYISKQARKQSPLLYEAKVREQSMVSLRKSASALLTKQLKASTLNTTASATVTGGKGVVDATTLRKIALAYGGDESVVGGAVLFLHKKDLIAFGDVRGTNERSGIRDHPGHRQPQHRRHQGRWPECALLPEQQPDPLLRHCTDYLRAEDHVLRRAHQSGAGSVQPV